MRPEHFNFQWFEQEDGRKKLLASIDRNGLLHLGKSLRAVLSDSIQYGFDSSARVLAIADGHGAGVNCPACGVLSARALCAQLSAIGLIPPVSFLLERDERTGFYLGKVALRGKRKFDMEWLLAVFRPLIDRIAHSMGKSTPLADRKSIVEGALCAAAQDYQPGFGDMETYLEERVRLVLRTENRQYVEAYGQRSLDQPLTTENDDGFCLYDIVAGTGSDWTDTLDGQVDAERFCAGLPSDQRELLRLLQDGFKLSEITDILGISERELRSIACEIARKRKRFEGEA